jgi:hypothetical protein
MDTVNRTEIADCIEQRFVGTPVSPTDLIEYAAEHGARTPVLQALERLHAHDYRELRELWEELSDVPVER